MKKSSKKLSGPGLTRFFKRFYQAQAGLDAATAERLAKISSQTFSSVGIRRVAWSEIRAAPTQADKPAAVRPAENRPAHDGSEALAPPPPGAFDPYCFGLVPIYQREGKAGLMTKLATVESVEHLRKMARAQQIALPSELRSGEIALDDLREAIAAAVEKRIANRRAAAG